jgi:hypothetical protein
MEFNIDQCESYTVKDIKDFAKSQNISLTGLTKKSQFCDRIKENLSSSSSSYSSLLMNYPITESTIFKGNVKYELLSLIYILRKHKNICGYFPFYKSSSNIISNNHSNYSITWNCDIEKGLTFPYGFLKQLTSCKERFFFIPFVLRPCDSSNEKTQHANMIVFDLKEKTIEQFDPHGKTNKTYKVNYELLKNEFAKLGYKYIEQEEICPLIGPQIVQCSQNNQYDKALCNKSDPEGFCSAFSMLYADLRFSYPDVKPLILLNDLIKEFQDKKIDITGYIRNYSVFIIKVQDFLNTNDEYQKMNEIQQVEYILNNFKLLINMNNEMLDWYNDIDELDEEGIDKASKKIKHVEHFKESLKTRNAPLPKLKTDKDYKKLRFMDALKVPGIQWDLDKLNPIVKEEVERFFYPERFQDNKDIEY